MNSAIPVALHFLANDPALERLIGAPVTEDWVLEAAGGESSGSLSSSGFGELLCSIAKEQPAPGLRQDVLRPEGSNSNVTLAQYTDGMLCKMKRQKSRSHNYVIGLNLLGFDVVESHIDQISTAVQSFLAEHPEWNAKANTLVFMVRNSEVVAPRDAGDVPPLFRELVEWKGRKIGIKVFGYHERIVYEVTEIAWFRELAGFQIQSDRLFRALNATADTVEEELIFRTNMQIGHFKMPSAHVRTHYNIGEFIQRDFVKEYFISDMLDYLADLEREHKCLVAVGMHEAALNTAAMMFASHDGRSDVVCHSSIESDSSRSKLKNCDVVVILTDVIYTGNTLRECLRNVMQAFADRKAPKKILLYAIARMRNSPEEIDDLPLRCMVNIRRGYYDPQNCPLCNVGQPLAAKGATIYSLDQFEHCAEQITPYDFWEAVGERDCLVFEWPNGATAVRVRVDTSKSLTKAHGLANRYRRWLRGLVRDHLADARIDRSQVNLILTVDEPSGIQFAEIVAQALSLSVMSIVPIPRGSDASNGLRGFVDAPERSQVLLVDDGINTGATMRFLAGFCKDGSKIVGAMVLDNMLTEVEEKDLIAECGMQKGIESLYKWRTPDAFALGQLGKMLELWDGDAYSFDPIGAMLDYHFKSDMPIDMIFERYPAMYDGVFAVDGIMAEGVREALVSVMAPDEGSLNRLIASENVKDSYGVLYEVAQVVARRRGGESGARRGGQTPPIANKETPPIANGRTYPAPKTQEQIEQALSHCTMPLVIEADRKKPVGTAFWCSMAHPGFGSQHPVAVTCAHVVREYGEKGLMAFYQGSYYDVNACFMDDADGNDVAFLGLRCEPTVQEFLSERAGIVFGDSVRYKSCGYMRTKGLSARHFAFTGLRDAGQTGWYVSTYESPQDNCGIDDGASGSPVIDTSGRLIGMQEGRGDVLGGKQEVDIVPIEQIDEAIERFGESR